jgi:hypothetical protein
LPYITGTNSTYDESSLHYCYTTGGTGGVTVAWPNAGNGRIVITEVSGNVDLSSEAATFPQFKRVGGYGALAQTITFDNAFQNASNSVFFFGSKGGDSVVDTAGFTLITDSALHSRHYHDGNVSVVDFTQNSLTQIHTIVELGVIPPATGDTISPSAISSIEAFGTAQVTPLGVSIVPSGIDSTELFGTPQLTLGVTTIEATAIPSSEDFGVAEVVAGLVTLSPSAIISEEAFGTLQVTIGTEFLNAIGITSEEAVGNAQVRRLLEYIFPTGIESQQLFGRAVVTGGDKIVIPIPDRVTYQAVSQYLKSLSFKGTSNDIIVSWLVSEGFDGQFNEEFHNYLGSLGYTGTFADRYYGWVNE